MAIDPIYFRGPALQKAKWVSYIEWECDRCEPVAIEWKARVDVPADYLEHIASEQPVAKGERAMDIAYALAVFNAERERNADYLLSLLSICNAADDKPGIIGICDDDRLVRELADLYWRGNEPVLTALLNSATSQSEAVRRIGEVYADLMDYDSEKGFAALLRLPQNTRTAVCGSAAKGDLNSDPPKRERVEAHLRALRLPEADDCAKQIEDAAQRR
jgi:hypothetical protein